MAVNQDSVQTGPYRDIAIYYLALNNSTTTVGTLQMAASNQPGGTGASQAWLADAFTLSGVNTNIAPITGGFDYQNNGGSVTVNSVPAGDAAVLGETFNAGNAATFGWTATVGGVSSGTLQAPSWASTVQNTTQSGGALITGLTAGTNVFTGPVSQASGAKYPIAVAIFTPLPVAAGTVWSGSDSSDWNTATNWVGGSIPTSGGTITVGGSGANSLLDLGNSNQTVGEIVFSSSVSTTIASAQSNTLILDNTGGTGGLSPAILSVTGNTHAITSNINLNSNAAITVTTGQLTLGANVANGVNGSAGLTLAAASNGTLMLAGNNTYSGTTSVAGGVLNVTGTLGNTPVNLSGGILSLQNAGAVSQNTITLSGGVLNETVPNAIGGTAGLSVNAGTTTLSQPNSYSGATTVSGAVLNVSGTLGNTAIGVTSGTLNLQTANAVSQNTVTLNSGALNQSVANAIGGTAALALNGGVTTLSQSNSYSGTTTVGSGAKLLVTNPNGSATGTSNVTVQSGGTLSGGGTIGAGSPVIVSAGGVLQPHLTAGGTSTLNLAGGLTANSAVLNYNFLAGNVSDQIAAGNLTLTGAPTLNIYFPAGIQTGNYQVITSSGTINDTSTISLGTPTAYPLNTAVPSQALSYTLYTPSQVGNPDPGAYTLSTQVLNATWTGTASTAWDTVDRQLDRPRGHQVHQRSAGLLYDTASGRCPWPPTTP